MTALARYIFDRSGREPMPPEAIVSEMCELFGCLPSALLSEDPRWIYPVLEYRIAQSAKAQFRQDASKLSRPQAQMLERLSRALRDEDDA